MRSFLHRWTTIEHATEDVSDERAIDAFRGSVRRRELKEELGRKQPKTIDHLMDIVNQWADGEDALQMGARSDDDDAYRRGDRRGKHKARYHDEVDLVAAGYADKHEECGRYSDRCDDRDGGYQRGYGYRGNGDNRTGEGYQKPRQEWAPKQPRVEGPTPQQLLGGPYTIHGYYDRNGVRKASNQLHECRHF